MKGVNFESLRKFLYYVFFFDPEGKGMSYEEACNYILPKQHNFLNPIAEEGASLNGTYIEYWYDDDISITYDHTDYTSNSTYKKVMIELRFLGVNAEAFAKSLHHTYMKPILDTYAYEILNGAVQSTVFSAIHPTNVDYFGQNSTIAFDTSVMVSYEEVVEIDYNKLDKVYLAHGKVI